MGSARFSEEFKRDAVAQVTERGYPVAEVSQRLGVSPHSLHAWKKQYGSARSSDDGKDAEIRRLKRELAPVSEECDILKKPPRISSRMQSEIRIHCAASLAASGSCVVALPAPSPQWLLCVAEELAEQTGAGRCSSDEAHPQGLGR